MGDNSWKTSSHWRSLHHTAGACVKDAPGWGMTVASADSTVVFYEKETFVTVDSRVSVCNGHLRLIFQYKDKSQAFLP